MKRFFYTIIVFFLPLVLLFGGLEYGLRSIPNDYKYKNHWLETNVSSVKILIIGSSSGYYGIRPQYLHELAFNAAHVSQSIRYDEYIVNKFIDNADSLRLLIWPITYRDLPYELEDDVYDWWRVKSYCIYYRCPYHPYQIKYNSEVVAGGKIFQEVDRVVKYMFTDYNERYCDTLGFGVNYVKSKRLDNWTSPGEENAINQTMDLICYKDVVLANKLRIQAVLHKCIERNIKVLFVTTPTCSSFYNHLDSTQLNCMCDFLDSLATNDNVSYLNLLKDSRFEEDDFFDAVHLEIDGATKLTKIVDEYIQENDLMLSKTCK